MREGRRHWISAASFNGSILHGVLAKPTLDGWIVDETKGHYEFAQRVPSRPKFGVSYNSLRSVYRRVQ
jgi:hypothetical protein